jgi:hypothetical protein
MVAKTINQQDLASGVSQADTAAAALTDDEIANILGRLQAIDFAALETKDQTIHVRVMQALLVKIVQRHETFVAMKTEAETRTRAAAQASNAANLAAMLAKLDSELRPVKKRWWRFGR